MDSIYTSAAERKFLDDRTITLKKLAETEKYGLTSLDRDQLKTILGFTFDEKKKQDAPAFIHKVLFSSNGAKEWTPKPFLAHVERSPLPRIFNTADDQVLADDKKSISKGLESKEVIAFLRTIMNYKRIYISQLGFKFRAVRHHIVGRVSKMRK